MQPGFLFSPELLCSRHALRLEFFSDPPKLSAASNGTLRLPGSMKALRLVAPGRPLELHEIPLPVPGPHDVLIRVKAAGVCHSDAHYRAGVSPAGPLPLTLGHEVAGVVESVGESVLAFQPGERVCAHYLTTCGLCPWCAGGHEQFCGTGRMLGKHRDGGFAEFIVLPARNLLALPESLSFAHGAVLMCSSATSFHALQKARLAAGETVAVFGVGGLGASAVQLALALGAARVFAVDLAPEKLALAEKLGAVSVNARPGDPVALIRQLTGGRGVDAALELIGLPLTMRQAVQSLGVLGRAAIAGLTQETFAIAPYAELLGKEAEIIGVSDHLMGELPALLALSRRGALDLSLIVTRSGPLEAGAVNAVLDELVRFGGATRTVILPEAR
jgi:propanol-preferring alcohol dehydrogenase